LKRIERSIAVLMSHIFKIFSSIYVLPIDLINKTELHKQHRIIHYTFHYIQHTEYQQILQTTITDNNDKVHISGTKFLMTKQHGLAQMKLQILGQFITDDSNYYNN